MQLSKHFYLKEFTVSETADRRGVDNTPSDTVKKNLSRICDDILEPLREAIQTPIVITSGYRCKVLNTLVGGSKNSQHVKGEAVDFIIPGVSDDEVFSKIKQLDLPYHQLINEYPSSPTGGWIHVSITPEGEKPRKQILNIGE